MLNVKKNVPYGEEDTDFGGNWNVPSAIPKNEKNGFNARKNSKSKSRKKRK